MDIRPWSECDAGPLREDLTVLLTPPVLAHLPDAVKDISGGMDAWIEAREAAADVFAVSAHGALIGLLFLFRAGDTRDIHVGYLFSEAVWGKGYASELVRALVSHGPKGEGVVLRAGVATGNPASQRVLVKAGFKLGSTDADTGIVHFQRAVP